MLKQILLLKHWAKMLLGRSYYHLPQHLGKAFQPNELSGYFNDMAAKTKWKGLLGAEGVPMVQLIDGSTFYFPTTIIQKALGHYDRYLLSREGGDLDEFIKICNWLVIKQDEKGGWDVQKIMNLEEPFRYSAMPQGEAISALLRAWKITQKEYYIESAQKAYKLMIKRVDEGGTAYYKDNETYLEEYPATEKNTVLNGWIFALFGIYDMFLATNDISVQAVFNQSFSTLKKYLGVFDAGFWSYYDEQKTLASPFYHNLHISQLEALFLVTGDETIIKYIEKWKIYRGKKNNRFRALAMKTYQKIRKPAPITIVK